MIFFDACLQVKGIKVSDLRYGFDVASQISLQTNFELILVGVIDWPLQGEIGPALLKGLQRIIGDLFRAFYMKVRVYSIVVGVVPELRTAGSNHFHLS